MEGLIRRSAIILFSLILLLPCICECAQVPDPDVSPRAMAPANPVFGGVDWFDQMYWREGMDSIARNWHSIISNLESFFSRVFPSWTGEPIVSGVSPVRLALTVLLFVVVGLLAYSIRALIRRRVQKALIDKKQGYWFDLSLAALSRPLSLIMWLWGGLLALSPLFIGPDGINRSNVIYIFGAEVAGIALPLAVIWFIYRLVNNFEGQLVEWASANQSKTDDLLVRLVGKTLQVIVVIVAAFMLIQNLTGVRVAPLLASLGLGGLAVALAAKDTLANLFGTLTIMMDKPFYLGQKIVVGGKEGSVEAVGYRSTRIRTPEGAQVSIPNSLVVNSVVENVGRRPYLKWETNLGLGLQTSAGDIKKAVRIVEDTLQNHEGMRAEYPPRIFFNDFSSGRLNISITAWYHPANWWDYQAWIQKTSLEIIRRFNESGIELAFPNQTVYVANAGETAFKLGGIPGRPGHGPHTV